MIRRTRQRQVIEQVFHQEGRPLSPNEVFDFASRLLHGLGLRTVYRQLRDMEAGGLIVGVDYPGQPLRYEWVSHRHRSHFICRACQRVLELDVEIPDATVSLPKGFVLTGQETVLYGACPDCSAKGSSKGSNAKF